MTYSSNDTTNITKINDSSNKELVELCKSLVANFQQRDDVMNKLVSLVKEMGSNNCLFLLEYKSCEVSLLMNFSPCQFCDITAS